MVFTPFLTYFYETIGRRIPLIYALLCTNLLFWLIPKVSPDFTLLIAIRSVIGLNNALLIGTPLIADYIKQESRGKIVALCALAYGLSQIFATQFLVPFTAHMNYE